MDQPLPRPASGPNNVVPLARTNVHGVRLITGAFGERDAIHRHDLKRAAVHMHGVDEVVVGADETQLYRLANPHLHGVGRRKGLSIDGEVVGERALHQHRGIGEPFALQLLLKLYRVFKVRFDLGRGVRRLDNERTVETECLLTVGMIVAVIEVCAVLSDGVFVAV